MQHTKANTSCKRNWIRWISKIITACVVLLLSCGILYGYLYITNLPPSDVHQPSVLLDNHHNVLTTFTRGRKQQTSIPLQNISAHVIQATIATEDRNFYHHIGIDFKGVARAIIVNVGHLSKRQGASTLTQQLARNLYLNHERTWSRKMKEALYALQLEMKYSKNDILEQYLNQVYYGHGAYGIEAAARLYFGKSAAHLTLAESALLVGIPRGPSYYSPYVNMKNAKDRQKIVLHHMVNIGAITAQTAARAYHDILAIHPQMEQNEKLVAPYFRDYVRQELYQLGISEQMMETGGFQVYTTLDKQAQIAAEQAIYNHIPLHNDLQAALISLDPRTGYIKAMVGGKNYLQSQYNRVCTNTRQPGSAFKPLVYLAALEKRAITAATHFMSAPTSFHYDEGKKEYKPSNYGNTYYGNIDLRRAIATSDNIFAVNTMMKIGSEQVISLARRLGIQSNMNPVPSLALGTFPVSPLEMASVYGVFSNEGKRTQPRTILKVIDFSGRVLYQAPSTMAKQVVDPAQTYVLTNLMESVFEAGGTGHRVASTIKRPVAGKTGTTDTDSWIVGYTPELSTAVWVGYDQGRIISVTDARKAAPIFAAYTERALTNVPPKIFRIPDQIVSLYIDRDSGKLAGDRCTNKYLETFVAGTEPVETCSLPNHTKQGVIKPTHKKTPVHMKKHSWWQYFKHWWHG